MPIGSQSGRAAAFIDRILKGAQAAELVEQPTRFDLVILKAAKTLGMTLPGTLIARADELVE